MADMNNSGDLGDIKGGFRYIVDVLDSMRAQNAMNSGDLDKVLSNINSRLENLSSDDDTDLIKVFLAEMKKSLEERHNFVSYKFSEIENSFNALLEKVEKDAKSDELRDVFNVIAKNLSVFSNEVGSQKEVLSDLGSKIEDLRQDDSQKRDILRNISVVKMEMEKFNNGFESLIVNLDENFKSISQALLKLDSSDAWGSVKKDVENIFLSSSAILSALQMIDRKNREFEEAINTFVTKDDFALGRAQVSELITQNIQMSQSIDNLPDNSVFDDLAQRVDKAVGIINALKKVLSESSDQNQKMLIAQLENLETKILEVSIEDEFVGFRKELSSFAEEVIKGTDLIRSDVAGTNVELKNLLAFLNSIEIKKSFEHFSDVAATVEGNIKQSVFELSNNLLKESGQNRNLIKTEVGDNIKEVSNKIDVAERNITELTNTNSASVLETIQSVISNIFSFKNILQKEILENAQVVDEKLQGLKLDLSASQDAIVKNSEQNLQNIVENIGSLSGKIDLSAEASGENSQKIVENIGDLSQKIDLKTDFISENSKQNFESIVKNIGSLSEKIALTKEDLNGDAQRYFDKISENISNLFQKISSTKDSLSNNAQGNFENIIKEFEKLSESLMLMKDGLTQKDLSQAEDILINFEGVYQRFENIQASLNSNAGTTSDEFGKIKANFEDLSRELELAKSNLRNVSQSNFDNITSNLQDLSVQLIGIKDELAQNSDEKSEGIILIVDRLSQEILGVKDGVGQASREEFAKIYPLIETFSAKVAEIKYELNQTSQEKSENVIANLERLSQEISTVKDSFGQIAQAQSSGMLSKISEEISGVKDSVGQVSREQFEKIYPMVESFSQKNCRNQR